MWCCIGPFLFAIFNGAGQVGADVTETLAKLQAGLTPAATFFAFGSLPTLNDEFREDIWIQSILCMLVWAGLMIAFLVGLVYPRFAIATRREGLQSRTPQPYLRAAADDQVGYDVVIEAELVSEDEAHKD